MTNPFRGLPSHHFWSSAVADATPGGLDPVVSSSFTIGVDDRVVTMGSCFAQHISRFLTKVGLHYHVTELADPSVTSEEATSRNYGIFTARFGNVYTVRQGVQLFDRAFGRFEPKDEAWEKGDRLVDPFRPQIEPDGFATIEDLRASRLAHLDAVRRMFIEADVIVFTLGLTEAWRSLADGSIFPMAPGVHGGSFSPDEHEFVNFTVPEIEADLDRLISSAREVNPTVRILLTVSPVPLIATYEPRHVLVSTVLSKSRLRVAAETAVQRHADVAYFPSYEVIAGSALGAAYFEPDLRSVSPVGVAHVMRLFERHMLPSGNGGDAPSAAPQFTQTRTDRGVVCDEELIESSLRSV